MVRKTVERLLAEFASGQYAVERPLPTHREWASRLKVSRITVSRAMEILKANRIIESKEGSYTFLARIPADPTSFNAGSSAKATVTLWQPDRRDLRKLRLALARRTFQDQFRIRHPQIQIDEQVISADSVEFEARLLQGMLHGDQPSCGTTTQTYLSFLLEHGSVAPLDVNAGADYLERIRPEYIKQCSRDGKLYLLPSYVSQSFLLFNKSILQKAGIDAAHLSKGWAQFIDACLRLSASQEGKSSFHVSGSDGLVWWLMALSYQSSSKSLSQPLPPISWNGSAAQQAVEIFLKLQSQRLIRVHCEKHSTIASRLLADEIPILLDDGSAASQVALLGESARFGIAPLPAGPHGEALCLVNCGGWLVNRHTHPEERLASATYALEWERWLHLGEGGERLNRFSVHPSIVSILIDSQQDRFVSKQLPDDWNYALRFMQDVARFEPADSDWKKKVLGHALEPMLRGPEPVNVEQVMQQLRLHEIESGLDKASSQQEANKDEREVGRRTS